MASQGLPGYRGFSSLRPLLLRYLPPSQPCLQLGMGSSQLHVDMVQLAAYQSIVSG
ncbi:endothelin-converting enzyme 2, partial [Haematococcus lacustris]